MMGRTCINDHRPGHSLGNEAWHNGCAQCEIERLRAALERERMRLAACGVVALANTQESAATARAMHQDYRSGSCEAVAHAVDEQMRLRAEYESACKLVADMHAAAVGYVGGPQIGAVEDVAALRAERERLRSLLWKWRWLGYSKRREAETDVVLEGWEMRAGEAHD